MKRRPSLALLLMALCACLALGGCASGATTTGGASPTAAKPPAATATVAKATAKPTAVPTITVAECQTLLSIAEANQIMQPPNPATTIDVITDTDVGASVCNYDYATNVPNGIDLAVAFMLYNGPVPIPQSTIAAGIASLTQQPNVTVNVATPVSGVGDQAEYLDVGTGSTFIPRVTIFYVLYGKVLFLCENAFNVGNSSATAQLNQLQQCGQTIVSRL